MEKSWASTKIIMLPHVFPELAATKYHSDPGLLFVVHHYDPTKLFFNMGQATPEPWFSTQPVFEVNTWNHVGFTFDDAAKVIRWK